MVRPRHSQLTSQRQRPTRVPRAAASTAQRGFSLLEVLVAFAILALSLGVLLQVFSQALNGVALSEAYSRATTLAEARLAAVGADLPLEVGSVGGEPEDGIDWVVSIEFYQPEEPLLVEDSGLQPYLVTAVASWPGSGGQGGGARRVVLRSLRLGPSL